MREVYPSVDDTDLHSSARVGLTSVRGPQGWRADQSVGPVHVVVYIEGVRAVYYSANRAKLGKAVAVELHREAVEDSVVVVDDLHLRSVLCNCRLGKKVLVCQVSLVRDHRRA